MLHAALSQSSQQLFCRLTSLPPNTRKSTSTAKTSALLQMVNFIFVYSLNLAYLQYSQWLCLSASTPLKNHVSHQMIYSHALWFCTPRATAMQTCFMLSAFWWKCWSSRSLLSFQLVRRQCIQFANFAMLCSPACHGSTLRYSCYAAQQKVRKVNYT